MNEVQDEYKGWLIFGSAVGDKAPYQCKFRMEKPMGFGVWVEPPNLPGGSLGTEEAAAQAGLRKAREFIDLGLTAFDSH